MKLLYNYSIRYSLYLLETIREKSDVAQRTTLNTIGNGNSWLLCITGNPSAEYDSEYGMGKIDVSAEWAEVGNPENQKDLYRNGMVDEVS